MVSDKIRIYNWQNAFLNQHGQYTEQILAGKYMTPELLVCPDVKDPMTFLRLYKLMESMSKKNIAQASLYDVPENKEHVRPLRILKPDEMETGKQPFMEEDVLSPEEVQEAKKKKKRDEL